MKATFLVEVDVGSDTNLLGIAEELQDVLFSSPFEVLSVKPWQRHSFPTGGATLPQTAEPSQQNQNNVT